MVMRRGVRSNDHPGLPLRPAAARAAVVALAVVAIAVLAARTGPSRYDVVPPLVAVFTLVAAVATGLRLLSDRDNGALSWGLAMASVALLGLSRVSGVATGSDVTSVMVFPLAILCLAGALLTLPRPGVADQPSDSSLPRLGADALVACFAVLFVAGSHVFVPGLDWHSPLSISAVVNVVLVMVLASAALICVGRLRATGGPPLECVLALFAGAILCGTGDLLFFSHAVSAHPTSAATPWRDLGGIGAMVGVAIAALVGPGPFAELSRPRPRRRREVLAALALVVPAGLVLVRVLLVVLGGHKIPTTSVVAVVGLVSAVMVRYALARLDHLTMTRTLEAQVEERTLALVTREQWFRSLVQNSSDVLTVVDPAGVVKYQSPAMTRVFGHDPATLIGTAFSYLMRPTDAGRLELLMAEARATPRATYTMELALWHREGRWCDTETTVTSLVEDKDIRGLVLNTRDISERKRLEDALTHQAFHDTLTGLANRALFQDRVGHALRAARTVATVAVLFLDLDGFKGVNDTQGHAVGDLLLGLVAERLEHGVRPADTVARLGGDEFAVLVEDPDCQRAAVWVAERVVAALNQPFLLDGRELQIGVSVGIALNMTGTESDDVLLRNADVAMYRAKAKREGGWVRFESGMRDALVEKLELENDLKLALGRGQLAVYYQPTVELARGRVVGAEALLRWHHPTKGLVGPDDFIRVAEDSGLITAIGDFVLREACRAGVRWQPFAAVGQDFRVAVNISARQVSLALVDTVRTVLADTGMPPGALVLEVTESVLVERTEEILALLHQLKALGVRLAIDDFGTGYSSLSYLSRFPVDILKIDRSFVEAVSVEGSEQGELARTILHLGQSMHLSTVAEGIETQAQYAALRAMGCDYGQGYLFSRALPPAGLDELLSFRQLTEPGSAPARPTPVPAPARSDDAKPMGS
jgi:diguanylate cyclase (GGDEF)-like protein/PAS domain S-box-containing protein